ncbi:HAD-IIIC family phosphatase [Aneurinibacillus terranovensis]|uniref:HAD-IIIC family phosphatase n=1 Tax=Aneurinibacillus terranovensis TaxID=278991 RepID=UPI0004124420|nr:HAD-IIIC family phosphatase [Aneurinibacillus terranovensis]
MHLEKKRDNIMDRLEKVDDQTPFIEWIKLSKEIKNLDKQEDDFDLLCQAKIAFITSFTTGYLTDFLNVLARKEGVLTKCYNSPYGQYMMEILNPSSGLYQFEPEVTFLALRPEQLDESWANCPFFEDPTIHIQKIITQIKQITDNFKRNSKGLLVIFNFKNNGYSPYGINDLYQQYGQNHIYGQLNRALFDTFKSDTQIRILDYNSLYNYVGHKTYNDRMYYLGDFEFSESVLPFLAKKILSYIIAVKGISKKCIIVDLDNTLWGGIIGEDGLEGIKLGGSFPGNAFRDFQFYLLKLHQTGVILAICSKNNLDDALEPIRHHPNMVLREKHFANIKANWNNKALNIKSIAEELNIGLESLVFIDDNPVEINLVKQVLPMVKCVQLPKDPALYVEKLKEVSWLFNKLSITEEDKERGKMYAEQRLRKEMEQSVNSVEEFLYGLDLQLEFVTVNEYNIARIAQLTQRTNQFNVTTKRYTVSDIDSYLNNSDYLVLAVRVQDKFGDYGIVGVVNIRKTEIWRIDTFLLSCRVLGRGIEKAMLNQLIKLAQEDHVETIEGVYVKTSKNAPCESLYKDNNFSLVNNDEKVFVYQLEVTKYNVKFPEWIKIR